MEVASSVQSQADDGVEAGAEQRRRRIRAARERVTAPLKRRAAAGVVVRAFDEIPWVALEVDDEALEALRADPGVLAVRPDTIERALLVESSDIVGALDMHEAGITGEGWSVAVLDTGVDANHYFLGERVVAEACFSASGSCPNDETEMIGVGAGAPCSFAPQSCLHGTHVAGIAAGSGTRGFGVARGAGVVSVQVFSRFTGEDCDEGEEDPCARTYLSDSLKALEYVYSLRQDLRIAAVNLSIGGDSYASAAECDAADPRRDIVRLLREAGIATVAAAGNEGLVGSLTSPGCLTDAVSVTATSNDDRIASFANVADFLDLAAPGVAIASSIPGDEFGALSGTSQAAPHVAGAFALLNAQMGTADPDAVEDALKATGLPVEDALSGLVIPRIRIVRALEELVPTGTPTGLRVTPDGNRTLLSKDVGDERWAIVRNEDDKTVTGNVFHQDGRDPSFVWCSETGNDGAPDLRERIHFLRCFGADACPDGSCSSDQWNFIAEVQLPGSFFLPREEPGFPVLDPGGGTSAADSKAAGQVSPDERRVLVSKDVEGKRWAIVWNDDGSITGNVYDPTGGPPQFVWCSGEGDDGNPDSDQRLYDFSCYGADPCAIAPCEDELAWTFINDVQVPGWFLRP